MVFCGLFPTDADQFGDLREALGRLQLNDAALSYEPEVSMLALCASFESISTELLRTLSCCMPLAIAAAVLSRPPCKAALALSSLGRELLSRQAAACSAAVRVSRPLLRSVRVQYP